MDKIILIYKLLKQYFYKLPGFLILSFVLIYLFSQIDTSLCKILDIIWIRLIIYILLILIWYIIWINIRNYFPSTDRDKIGIIVAINAENEKQRTRIKVDFVNRLKSDLNNNNLLQLFDIVVLNDFKAHLASKIIEEYEERKKIYYSTNEYLNQIKPKEFIKLKKLQRKTKGHLFIYGNIIERMDLDNKYIINLNGLVSHKPIKLEQSKKLSHEFISIFPKEISFFEKFELKGFKFSADTIYLGARYITGLAALYSGDPHTALSLHDNLHHELKKYFSPLPPNLLDISKKLIEFILTEKYLIAKYHYEIENNLKKTKEQLKECLKINPDHYDTLILFSYINFKDDQDPVNALRKLNKASRVSKGDYTWLYNKAFIMMYLNKFEKALKCYKKIAKIIFVNESFIVDQCLSYNKTLFKNDRTQVYCLYVIGFLYYKKKLNLPLALENFEKFQKLATKKIYNLLVRSAKTYIIQIKREMDL